MPWSFVCSKMSLTNLLFWPMYLPLTNPDWSRQTRSGRTFSNILAITLDTIL